MAAVSEILKTTFDSARARLAGLEKHLIKLEKKAERSLSDIQTRFDLTPKRLEGAWTEVTAKIKPALIFATREELRALATKVDELSAKIEKLAHTRNGRGKTPAA